MTLYEPFPLFLDKLYTVLKYLSFAAVGVFITALICVLVFRHIERDGMGPEA